MGREQKIQKKANRTPAKIMIATMPKAVCKINIS